MQRRELLRVVRALLEQPTAPFHEEAVRNAIVAEVRLCLALAAGTTKALDPVKSLRAALEKKVTAYKPFFRRI